MAGEPVRLVRCRHAACGTSTRVRVPQALPARAVRRVVCEGCRQAFDCDGTEDAGVVEDARGGVEGAGDVGFGKARVWKYLSLPLAAAAVIGVLILVQGSGGEPDKGPAATPTPAPAETAKSQSPGAASKSGGGAQLVKGSSYTLALPNGWTRTEPQNGATFAAAASGGGAEATLWVRRDPSLSFPEFETQSLAHLRQVAGSAGVTDRTAAPRRTTRSSRSRRIRLLARRTTR